MSDTRRIYLGDGTWYLPPPRPPEPTIEQLRAWYAAGSISLTEYERRVALTLAQDQRRQPVNGTP